MRKPPPFVLMSGLLLTTIGVVQLGYLAVKATAQPSLEGVQVAELNMDKLFQKKEAPRREIKKRVVTSLVRERVDAFSHNPIQGSRRSDVELTIFTDTLCGSCRAQVRRVLADIGAYRDKVKIVYKFKPKDDNALDGGIFEQIAARQGIHEAYQEEIGRASSRLEIGDLVGVLEKSGLPFDKQRAAMSVHMASILSVLQKDINQAKELGIQRIPAIYINGYQLDQPGLPSRYVGKYVETLLARKELEPVND